MGEFVFQTARRGVKNYLNKIGLSAAGRRPACASHFAGMERRWVGLFMEKKNYKQMTNLVLIKPRGRLEGYGNGLKR